AVVHIVFLIVFALLTAGFCTRVTSVLSLLAALSYIHRAPSTLFGMDTIMNIALLYLSIGASGAALSVDRWLALRWARRKGKETGQFLFPPPQTSANFALRLMQIHICIIYFASGTSKLLVASWWNGNAVWGTMANYAFSLLNIAAYNNLMSFLAHHRCLW